MFPRPGQPGARPLMNDPGQKYQCFQCLLPGCLSRYCQKWRRSSLIAQARTGSDPHRVERRNVRGVSRGGSPRSTATGTSNRLGSALVAVGGERAVLLLADRVNRLAKVADDVERSKTSFSSASARCARDGVDVGLPHVHRHGFDALQLGGSERVEVAVKTRLTALIGDLLDRGAVKVCDDGDVVLPMSRLTSHRPRRAAARWAP